MKSSLLNGVHAVILAGGLGSRLSEETNLRPKPMVEVGDKPILWHIMKYFSCFGISDFIICLGYKGNIIKDYFSNLSFYNSDILVKTDTGSVEILKGGGEAWNIRLIETGKNTQTGGRLLKIKDHVPEGLPFFFTYGDGLTNLNLHKLWSRHRGDRYAATVTAVLAPARFGAVKIDSASSNRVISFREKPLKQDNLINGGYFLLDHRVFGYIDGDSSSWEHEPIERLIADGLLQAHIHNGFWYPMDTLRDKIYLNDLWESGLAPWALWEKS